MKRMFFSLFVLVFVSCTTESKTEEPIITPVLIAKGHLNYNTTYRKENIVITNNSDWQKLLTNFNSITAGITTTFNETTVDFKKHQVIVAMDVKNLTSTVDITAVIENENNIIIEVKNLNLGVSQDISNPFHIVKIAKTEKPILFK